MVVVEEGDEDSGIKGSGSGCRVEERLGRFDKHV